MGINDAARSAKEDKARNAIQRKEAFKRRNAGGETADWATVDGHLVCRAVAAISRNGGAIRLGYTRDGGAYAIGLYDGDDKQTVYCTPAEGVTEVLNDVIEYYEK